jgi:hypothetical protein
VEFAILLCSFSKMHLFMFCFLHFCTNASIASSKRIKWSVYCLAGINLRSAFHRRQGRKEMEGRVEGGARKRGRNGQRHQSNAWGGAEWGRGSPALALPPAPALAPAPAPALSCSLSRYFLPTISHLLTVNKLHSLSPACSLTLPFRLPLPLLLLFPHPLQPTPSPVLSPARKSLRLFLLPR